MDSLSFNFSTGSRVSIIHYLNLKGTTNGEYWVRRKRVISYLPVTSDRDLNDLRDLVGSQIPFLKNRGETYRY